MGLINKKIKLDDFAKEVTKTEQEAANLITLIRDHILNSSLPVQYYNGDFKQIKPKKIQITKANDGYEIKFQGGGKNYLHLYLKKQKTGYSLEIPPAQGNDLQLVNPEVIQKFVRRETPEVYEIFNILRQAMQEQLKIHEQARIQKQKFHDGKLPYKNLLPYMKKVIGFKVEKEKKIESTKEENIEPQALAEKYGIQPGMVYEGMKKANTRAKQSNFILDSLSHYEKVGAHIKIENQSLTVDGVQIQLPNTLKDVRSESKSVEMKLGNTDSQIEGSMKIKPNNIKSVFGKSIGEVSVRFEYLVQTPDLIMGVKIKCNGKDLMATGRSGVPLGDFNVQEFDEIIKKILTKDIKPQLESKDKQ